VEQAEAVIESPTSLRVRVQAHAHAPKHRVLRRQTTQEVEFLRRRNSAVPGRTCDDVDADVVSKQAGLAPRSRLAVDVMPRFENGRDTHHFDRFVEAGREEGEVG
jgi:hypothetical protein